MDGNQVPREIEQRVVDGLSAGRAARVALTRSQNAVFVQERPFRTSAPFARHPESLLYLASARVDNRDELASAFGIERPTLAQISDAALVGHAFAVAGDAELAKIVGTFALAIWDEPRQRLVLARDFLGDTPLFYCARPSFVAFATTLKGLLALPFVPREIDDVMLGHFLALNLREPIRTLYRGIERVPSRTRVTIDSTGIRRNRYWEPNLRAQPCSSEQDYVEAARELLDRSVLAAMRDTPRAALLLSGGLDSSAIAATCARLGLAGRVACYTGAPPGDVQDDAHNGRYLSERSKVEALRRLYPDLDVTYIVPPLVHAWDDDPARHFVRSGLPVRNVANFGWFAALQDAIAPNIHTVMLGRGGNLGLSWDGLFSLAELLQSGRMNTFARELAATARESGQGIIRTFHREVVLRTMPDALYRTYRRLRGLKPEGVSEYSVLNPEFVANHGLVRAWRRLRFDPSFSLRHRSGAQIRAYHMFDHNQNARDAGALHYRAHGQEARTPLNDRRLLEFCLAVPEPMFRQNGVPRSFARRVLADRLPPEILDERRRGVQAPTWFRTLDARRADIARDIDRFETSPLARRLLDLPRMKHLMSEWPKDETIAARRKTEYRLALTRGVHIGQFIRWVEGGNS